MAMPLRIAHVVAEYAGLAQTGGLADAVAALTKEMSCRGHDVRIYLPHYAELKAANLQPKYVPGMDDCVVAFGDTEYTFSFLMASAPDSGATLCLIDCPEAYARPGIYSGDADEHHRFALLARAALEGCQRLGWAPDILHCHDWHAGLLPWYVRTLYSWDPLFEHVRTVLTIHNLAYQGVFDGESAEELGTPRERVPRHPIDDDDGTVNFLATGIRHADAVTTVSPTYAREILTPEQGMGLDELLRWRGDKPVGILNGVDYERWDPAHDPLIARNYSSDNLSGKSVCRQDLLESLDLAPDPTGPVLGIVSRLAAQKGLELVTSVLPEVLGHQDIRLVVLGTGESEYETFFSHLAKQFPDKVAFRRAFDLRLAHRIEAGSDIFLMSSRFEPCGLNQMYSLRYGTPPLVHRTGGLADTVEPFHLESSEGTGFVFEPFGEKEFRLALDEAILAFRDRQQWERLMRRGMSLDFSWARQVEAYLETYDRLLA
jgi:starch synthase